MNESEEPIELDLLASKRHKRRKPGNLSVLVAVLLGMLTAVGSYALLHEIVEEIWRDNFQQNSVANSSPTPLTPSNHRPGSGFESSTISPSLRHQTPTQNETFPPAGLSNTPREIRHSDGSNRISSVESQLPELPKFADAGSLRNVYTPAQTVETKPGEVVVHQLIFLIDNTALPSTPSEVVYFRRQTWGKDYRDTGPVFIAAIEPGKHRIKLRRWSHRNPLRHFTGFELQDKFPGIRLDERFEVYVWEKWEDGLIPIYCSTRADGSDPYLSTDKEHHEEKIEEDWIALKIRRKNQRTVFYAKPLPMNSD